MYYLLQLRFSDRLSHFDENALGNIKTYISIPSMAYEKTHLSNPSPKMSYLSKGIICLLSLTNHLMDCILTCRTSDMLLNFT